MRIALVHNEVKETGRTDEKDVLIQAEAISKALGVLGHQVLQLPCSLNLSAVKDRLEDIKPDLIFNLAESLGGEDRLIHLFPALLDAMGVPYTGAGSEAILMTSHKVLSKERMSLASLPTPEWIGPYPSGLPSFHRIKPDFPFRENQWIVKSLWEHGSLGLDENNIISGRSAEELEDILKERAAGLGGACFAEIFIPGREFNLSVLDGPDGPMVLPPAEIIFEGYDNSRPSIVDYKAKWDEASYEYHHTNRSFDFSGNDQPLLFTLKSLALRCWNVFGLKGYARVDFRVDEKGQPWILEVNTNPCLNPDAGFVAAAVNAGLAFEDIVENIIAEGSTPQASVAQDAPSGEIKLRYEVKSSDADGIRRLTEATGFFYPAEIDVAEELVLERLSRGEASGYYFVLAEQNARLVGYTCYGPIPCTASSFDFYWIAVHPDLQGKGLGKVLVKETESLIKKAKGERIYVETSQRPLYDSTRAFYEKAGYKAESLLKDFYGPGDGRVTYSKALF
jgi:D-alanine-D-alanine ligase